MEKHLCFYSNKCRWSKAFIQEISATPYKSQFQYVCVDPPLKHPLPGWLKKVPTLKIQGEEEPRVDGDVMNWISEMKMKDQPKNSVSNSSPSQNQNEPDGWSMSENVSFAKGVGYSFNDADTSVEGNGGSTIPGSFSFLNGGNSTGDRTSQGNYTEIKTTGPARTKKEELFDKQMQEYQRQRDDGVPKPAARS